MEEKPNIKHIVISGGCIWGLYEYGALRELHECGFWNNQKVESIYGTSVGALIAVILALKIDFETIDKYIIERPWDEVFKKHSYNVLDIYNNRGVFHKKVLYEFYSPLFKSCDIETSITMGEFYEKTGI
jgi:predicted acylesterase/phospholipase RssA